MSFFDKFKENLDKVITVPALLSTANFLANLLAALKDNNISDQEFHALLQMSSGIEAIILFAIMAFLRIKK